MKRLLILLSVLIALLCIEGLASNAYAWGWKKSTTPRDVVNFLNGAGQYKYPIGNAKITTVWKDTYLEFYVFYERGRRRRGADRWRWKKSTTPDDVINFLNGAGSYRRSVKNATIGAVWKGTYLEFYIFYQRERRWEDTDKWRWKKSTTHDDVINFLNGTGGYSRPAKEAIIATVWKSSYPEFYIFHRKGRMEQPGNNWSWGSYAEPSQVQDLLNTTGAYPQPVRDAKIVSAIHKGEEVEFHVFKPQGFLIVTRPLFEDSLDEYIQWKYSTGFEVYVVTAEWIQDHVNGDDLRVKMRNCIRYYYNSADVRYAVLIGDSIDIPVAPDADTYQEPPRPVLSEDWNLPAGYYRWDCWNFPQFTTLYYSDLSEKLHYQENESYWQGDYSIYIGIMPVRTTGELQNILAKAINYSPASKFTFVYSEDLYSQTAQDSFQAIQALAGPDVSMDLFVFDATSSSEDIYSKLSKQQGNIVEHGHGNVGIFKIGDTIVNKGDASRFMHINPLFIASSCSVQAYHLGECLDEAFLKAEKGPAVITTTIPWGRKSQEEVLSPQTKGFWEDLLAGKTIGQAFCDHCKGAWQNPLHLFGDPSLVIVK